MEVDNNIIISTNSRSSNDGKSSSSISKNNISSSNSHNENLTLSMVLTDFEFSSRFTEFLHSTLSVENLSFWLAVENYKRFILVTMDTTNSNTNILYTMSPEALLKAKAMEIYDKYFKNNCLLNLDAVVINELEHKIKSNSDKEIYHVFDEAQTCVTALLQDDCIPKFKKRVIYIKHT